MLRHCSLSEGVVLGVLESLQLVIIGMFSWSFTMRITLWEAYQRCLCSEFSLVVVHFHTSICAQYELFVYRRCGALRAWSRGHYACFSDCRMVILQRHLFEGRRRPSPIGFAIPIGWLDITGG